MIAIVWIVGLLLIAAGYFAYQTWIVQQVELPLTNPAGSSLSAEISVVQLSDFHGRTRFLNGSISRLVNRLQPDIVCVTGDLTNHLSQRANVIAELEKLECRHILFIPGNHEHYEYSLSRRKLYYSQAQIDETMRLLRQAGITVLNNSYAVVDTAAGRVAVSGFDNSFYGNEKVVHVPETEQAVYKIALGHSPNIGNFLKKNAIDFDLLLAGHTHGGQVKLFGWTYGAYRRYHTGLMRLGASSLFYISRGLGNVHLPIRIGSRPEITVFRLSAEKAASRS